MTTTSAAPPFGRPERERAPVLPALALAGGAALAGALAGYLVVSGRPAAVLALAVVLLPVALWRRPALGPPFAVAAALLVEQFDHFGGVGPGSAAATTSIPLFHGLGPLPVNAADVLLGLLLAVYVAKAGTSATGPWPRTPLALAVGAVLATVLLGVVLGIARGGDTRFALLEARPYLYLSATFLLASTLLTTRAAMRAVVWGFVVAVGFKAAQGLFTFLAVRGEEVRPEAVLGHEEALFFGLFLVLTVGLWLFELRGPLRTTATALAPVVVLGDLANQRRAAWLILIVGFVVLGVVAYRVLPYRRRFLLRAVIALGLVAAVYLPAYWERSGGFAQPARAVRSVVAPTPRDESSNHYRMQEDANLIVNIRQGFPLGKGFGVPIDYVLPIVDLSEINPFIDYIPHNGVFYVLMRTGIHGAVAFWTMLGLGILLACRLARSRDRELALIGALVTVALVAYAFEGAVDQGFFFYRIAFLMGTLLGLAEAAQRMSMRSRVHG